MGSLRPVRTLGFAGAAGTFTALFLAGISTAATAAPDLAASLSCRANVALNRVYDVQVDEETGDMVVTNDAGTRLSGRANRYLSGRTGDVTWYLATGFASGVELQVEAAGAQRVAFCLADNECYLCRR